jgi:hypothetical protein
LTLLVEPVNWIHLGFESLLSNSHAAMLQGLFLFGGEGGIAGLRPLTASRFALRRLTLLVEPVNWIHLGFESLLSNSHAAMLQGLFLFGGEGGIRTLDTLLTYTHFPGVLLQPLGHFS